MCTAASGCGAESATLRERIEDAATQLVSLTDTLTRALQEAASQVQTLEPAVKRR